MLWTVFIVLLALWLLGMLSGHASGGFIHLLLIGAVAVLIFNLFKRRRAW